MPRRSTNRSDAARGSRIGGGAHRRSAKGRSARRRSSIDGLAAAFAARQKGLVTRAQLVQAGVGAGAVDDRVKRGALHVVHAGVYLVGHALALPLARELAALLAAGEGAILSHRSAALVWGIIRAWNGPVEVTCPRRIARPGIRGHQRRLRPADIRQRDGLWVTSPERTLIDVATVLAADELEQAVAQAIRSRLTSERALQRALGAAAGAPGTAALRAIVLRQPRLTRSRAERLLLDLVRRAGLPLPEANVRIHGREVDLLWRRERLVVEFDGFAFHGDRRAFEDDRRRDQDLVAAGWRVLRVTWRQLEDAPEAVLVRIAQALAARA